MITSAFINREFWGIPWWNLTHDHSKGQCEKQKFLLSLLKFRPSLHRHTPIFQWLMRETGLLVSLFAQKYPKMSLSGRSRYCRKLNCSNSKCYKRFVKYYGLIILVCLWIKQYRPACVNAVLALSLYLIGKDAVWRDFWSAWKYAGGHECLWPPIPVHFPWQSPPCHIP